MDVQNKNIMIDEQDLFEYVFYPKKLVEAKRQIIDADNSYTQTIEFYRQLKSDSETETELVLKRKLAAKIPAYSFENVIELKLVNNSNYKKLNSSRLAAGSTELKPGLTTKTFIDNNKEYLIKVLTTENETKVFVFSTSNDSVSDFDILIEPNNLKYHFDNNSEPLIIKELIDIDRIQIQFSQT